MTTQHKRNPWRNRSVILSLLLFFFTIPHTLEDFSLGEPAKNGVPVAILAAVIAALLALQGLALFWLGQNDRRGYFIHLGLGLFWPLAAGSAQLPVILTFQPYRAGFLSLHYVFGMIILGILLFLASIFGLRSAPTVEK